MLTQTLDFTKDFPKAYRYSVGEQMQNIAMRMVNEVASGYITRNVEKKIDKLDDFQADFNTFKTFFRIASERRKIESRSLLNSGLLNRIKQFKNTKQ